MGRTSTGKIYDSSGQQINPATEESLNIIAGFVTGEYDTINPITYVASGNGVGEIETVTYRSGGPSGTIVTTLTLGYNADNKLSSVTNT